MKISTLFFIALLSLSSLHAQSQPVADNSSLYKVSVPTNGNSWVPDANRRTSEVVSSTGISRWSESNLVIRTYFYAKKACKLSLALEAGVAEGTSEIKVSFNKETKSIKLTNKKLASIYIGEFPIQNAGYYYVDLQGLTKTGKTFANVKSIQLGNEADAAIIKFVKDDVYFGRRGPSVHLSYKLPTEATDVEWFYNEVEVEPGQDALGSYFMANGFGEGYFGMQVNSPTERRILFSLWSPFSTDDPKSIPADSKIKLLEKGEGVHTGEFGNEGSGGQSYLVFNWKAGVRYKFLLHGKPTNDNTSTYTAYLFDPQANEWKLIASFNRPKTSTYLKHLHSFLENFSPDNGITARKCGYFNQWVADKNGVWYEVNHAQFTADATAHGQFRFDYSGGTDKSGFYLKNCGFSNDLIPINSLLERPKLGVAPKIDFSQFK